MNIEEEFEKAYLARDLVKMKELLDGGFRNLKTSKDFNSCESGPLKDFFGPNTQISFDWTFLHDSIQKGDYEVFELLLNYCTQKMVDSQEGHSQRTPLHVACHRASIPMISALLDKGASPWLKDKQSRTPLDVLQSSTSDSWKRMHCHALFQIHEALSESIALDKLASQIQQIEVLKVKQEGATDLALAALLMHESVAWSSLSDVVCQFPSSSEDPFALNPRIITYLRNIEPVQENAKTSQADELD